MNADLRIVAIVQAKRIADNCCEKQAVQHKHTQAHKMRSYSLRTDCFLCRQTKQRQKFMDFILTWQLRHSLERTFM